MLEVTNAVRSEWADQAVDTFARASGMEYEDDQARLTDLLADLMHWAEDRKGGPDCRVDFAYALSTAQMHYEAERGGEGRG